MYYISGHVSVQEGVYAITDSSTNEVEEVSMSEFGIYNSKYLKPGTRVLGYDKRVSPLPEIIPRSYIDLLEYCSKDIIKYTLAGAFYDDLSCKRFRLLRGYNLIDITNTVFKYFSSVGIDSNYPVVSKYGVGYLELEGNYIKLKPNNIMIGLAQELNYKYIYNTNTNRIYLTASSGGSYSYYDMIGLEMI